MANKNSPAPAKANKNSPAPAKAKDDQEVGPVHDYGEQAGAGYEGTTTDDFAIPYLNLLQAMSPEVAEDGSKLEGASAGMMVNSVTKELYDGKKGLVFVPCSTSHVFVEWRPRDSGGGIVARHLRNS